MFEVNFIHLLSLSGSEAGIKNRFQPFHHQLLHSRFNTKPAAIVVLSLPLPVNCLERFLFFFLPSNDTRKGLAEYF